MLQELVDLADAMLVSLRGVGTEELVKEPGVWNNCVVFSDVGGNTCADSAPFARGSNSVTHAGWAVLPMCAGAALVLPRAGIIRHRLSDFVGGR